MLVFLVIVFGLYTVLVMTLVWGWALLSERATVKPASVRKISVVVAFRNEEKYLPELIAGLKALDYPRDDARFILIDDRSTDKSADITTNLIAEDNRFTLQAGEQATGGKKRAISIGIALSDAEIIVTTDADCRVPEQWLRSINAKFEEAGTRMVVGPVRLAGGGLPAIQSMEFATLIGTAGATISLGHPTMCNAANLAFRRNDFLAVGGFEGNEEISSGDDQFLMNKFATKWNGGVKFLYDAAAVVSAQGSASLSDFIAQRLRWAGKWKFGGETSSWLALAILGFHICNVAVVVAWAFGAVSTQLFIVLAGAKLFAEMIFLFPVCRFLDIRWSWPSFIFLQLFYSLYVIAIGFLSQVLTARWKGREVSTRPS
jgi:biofilm PGA synthesis N-glycosyltransferase PgaC